MNMWCHLPTSLRRRRLLPLAILLSIVVAFITTLLLAISAHAETSTNRTIAFQGRLLTSAGAVVPDGHYNMQFKIYEGGSGAQAGNPDGALKWSDTHINNGGASGIEVRNGFFSVSLGSNTPFANSINWNAETLWLSMNIAGTAADCTSFGSGGCVADGEMLPMKQLTATPYAINAGHLEGIKASGFIQNTLSAQTANITLDGNVTANTLQGNTSVIAPLFDTDTSGALAIGTVNASTITIGSAATTDINIGVNGDGKNVTIGSRTGLSGVLLQGGEGGVRIETDGGFAISPAVSGINAFEVSRNGSTSVRLTQDNIFSIGSTITGRSHLTVDEIGNITVDPSALLQVKSRAIFEQGITLQATLDPLQYITPKGYSMNTMINIPNFDVQAYSSIIAFGLPETSSSTARGMLVADARTTAHQASIGVLSPDENNILGFSWNGSNTTGSISTTGEKLSLQGGSLDILTASSAGGVASVGIGNNATSGHALDVTGNANVSGDYYIDGQAALTNSSLAFNGGSTASITTASSNSLTIAAGGGTRASFNSENIQIGDGAASSSLTLLTLDQATGAPVTSLEGSMYYDTTLGKVQCYEADGWGACGAAPDTFVTLTPEYAGGVMHGTDIGEMSTDFCSDTLNINDGSSAQPTICGLNETQNLYNWTTTEITEQTRSIFVTYQLPGDFKQFVTGSTSVLGRTDAADANVKYQIYRSNNGGLSPCSTQATASTGAQSLWQKSIAAGAQDPINCGFSAGDNVIFRIDLSAANNAHAYASNINFVYSNQ